MTRRYVVALSVIALLSTGAHIALRTVLSTGDGSAAQINVGGGQRMLAQRIALFSGLLAAADDTERAALRTELRSAADEMATAHRALRTGDAERGLPGGPS